MDSAIHLLASYEQKQKKYFRSALNCARMMACLSSLTLRQMKSSNYESDVVSMYQVCLDEYLSQKKEGERNYVVTLLEVGKFYQRVEKLDQAQKLFLEVMKKAKGFLSTNDMHSLKNDIIAYYLTQGNVKQAKKMLQELGCPDTKLPSDVLHAVYGITLTHWANVAILEGKQDIATKYLNLSMERCYRDVPRLSQMLRMNKIPDFLSAMCLTARFYAQKGHTDEAFEIYAEVTRVFKHILLQGASDGYDTETIWNVLAHFFNEVERFAWKHKRYDVLYDQTQLTKYLFTVSVAYKTRNVDLYKDAVWREQMEQLDSLRRSPGMLNIYLRGDITPKVISDIRGTNINRQLAKRWIQKELISLKWPLGQEELSATLSGQEAVIDFITIDVDSEMKQYGAFVATHERQSLVFIPVCTEQELKIVLEKPINQRCRELYQLIWQPLEAAIKGRSNLYIASSDLLNRIPFVGIETPEGALCDQYTIRFISSISLVDRLKANSIDYMSKIKNIFLYGGADFGLLPEEPGTTRGQGFSYLPGSKREVTEIARNLSPQWKVKAFTGKEATEEQFANLSYQQESPCVVHVSTHGFYLPYSPEERAEESSSTGVKSYTSFFEPLLRSGFALSGANRSWNKGSVPLDLHDGVLTGYEIAGINLSNTELVVLSACNTGLEEIRVGTVSRGLQHAFFRAGARAVMTSLWEVPDKETEIFMKEFYAQWMSGITLSQAFVNTQRMMRKAYPNDAEKWAGFVLME